MPRPTAFDRSDITERTRRALAEDAAPTYRGLKILAVVLAPIIAAGYIVGVAYASTAKGDDVSALTARLAVQEERSKATDESVRELRIEFRERTDSMTKLLIGIAREVGAPTETKHAR